jgi:hypothetical protein
VILLALHLILFCLKSASILRSGIRSYSYGIVNNEQGVASLVLLPPSISRYQYANPTCKIRVHGRETGKLQSKL